MPEQSAVDAMAKAIEDAIKALQLKPALKLQQLSLKRPQQNRLQLIGNNYSRTSAQLQEQETATEQVSTTSRTEQLQKKR